MFRSGPVVVAVRRSRVSLGGRQLRSASFTPAENGGARVPVWIRVPVTFAVADAGQGGAAAEAGRAARGSTASSAGATTTDAAAGDRSAPTGEPTPADRGNGPELPEVVVDPDPAATPAAVGAGSRGADTIPEFTPMELAPRLVNSAVFARELERRYPALLRDAGVEGVTTLWVQVDERGNVVRTRVYRSSGHEELDRVATEIMREVAEFTPAMNRDEPVAVWIQIPITFAVTP